MFDIGFTELMVIGVVALLVIGPERLPKVARAAGQWMGRLNRYVSQVKQDINRDIQLQELRQLQQQMRESAQQYEIMASDAVRQVEAAAESSRAGIDKVVQAMSLTDGGLTQREVDKLRAETAQAPESEVSGIATEHAAAPVPSPSPVTEQPARPS